MVSTVDSPLPFHSPSPHLQQKKKAMSITQTYFLAHKARAKLSTEAARPDHNLRLLVGHANLLDSLMLELAEAEREQESWFNQSVRGATPKAQTQERHIQWADSIAQEEDWEADSSDSDDDSEMGDDEDEDIEMYDAAPLTRIPSHPHLPALQKMDTDEEVHEEDDEDFVHLGLTRSPSHLTSPPELEHDSESSEDESMPPSPPTTSLPTFSDEQHDGTIPTKYYDSTQEEEEEQEQDKSDFYNEGFYLPPRNPNRLISSISVY